MLNISRRFDVRCCVGSIIPIDISPLRGLSRQAPRNRVPPTSESFSTAPYVVSSKDHYLLVLLATLPMGFRQVSTLKIAKTNWHATFDEGRCGIKLRDTARVSRSRKKS